MKFFPGFSGTGAPGSSGQDTDVDDNRPSIQKIVIAVGVPCGAILFAILVVTCKRHAHHHARTARTARHPSPSAPRQELAEVENDYTCPPPTNPRFVQVNEA